VQGAVLLVLERHERISLSDQAGVLPGATGLRALAAVLSQHGEDTMLAVYDKAAQLRPGRAVVDTTVNLAVRGLLTPPPTLDVPAAARTPRPSRTTTPVSTRSMRATSTPATRTRRRCTSCTTA
jgi:hypothetical protein